MSKPINNQEIYVSSERDHAKDRSSDYRYNIWFYGEFAISDMTPEDAREIIACLQHAIEETGQKTSK